MLEWLESSSLAVWVGQSTSVWAMPTILTLHTMGLAVLVGASWVLDLRLLGMSRHIPLSAFRWVFPVITVGLAVNLATGVMLFTKSATTLGTAVPFLIKMVLVAAGVATLMPIRALVLRSDPLGQERSARVSAAPAIEASARPRRLALVSILAWAGAVTAGRLLAYLP